MINLENGFDETFAKMSKVPTGVLKELTEKSEKSELERISEHTKVEDFSFTNNTGQNSPQNGEPGSKAQSLNAGGLISPKMAMQLLNVLMPTILTVLLRNFAKKQVNKRSLEATKEERDIIEPVLANYLQSVQFNVEKPINALIITVAMVYGTKVIEVINEAPGLVKNPAVETVKYNNSNNSENSSYGVNANGTLKKDSRGRPKKK